MNDYPKNSFELDTFLKRLIENPFLYLFEFPKEKPTISNYVSNIFDKEDISDILYLEEKKNSPTIFKTYRNYIKTSCVFISGHFKYIL